MIELYEVTVSLNGIVVGWGPAEETGGSHMALFLDQNDNLFVQGECWGWEPVLAKALRQYFRDEKELADAFRKQIGVDQLPDLAESPVFVSFLKLCNRK